MPWTPQTALVLALSAAVATGCAHHLGLQHGGDEGWSTGYLFWPPPEPTSVWTTDPQASATRPTFSQIAERIADVLQQAGYREQHVYPVGVGYAHGFAVTTRLERIRDDGAPAPLAERWSARFPGATELRWLAVAREPRFDQAGRYRALLLAFTDLPLEGTGTRPPVWNAQTVMAGPELPAAEFPATRRVPSGARVILYVYEYRAASTEGEGAFVAPDDASVPAAAHVRASGLLALAGVEGR
jgi:hypothetical protein